jgi:hypothetical protein
MGRGMKWWVKAIIASVVWIVVIIAAGMIHTNVVLAGAITSKQAEAILDNYAFACGVVLGASWTVLIVWRLKRKFK